MVDQGVLLVVTNQRRDQPVDSAKCWLLLAQPVQEHSLSAIHYSS